MKTHPKIIEMSKKYNKPVEEFLLRMDGRVEWTCEHGVSHTVWYPKGSSATHGCDFCCSKLKKESGDVQGKKRGKKN